jgi:hypothetical protein
MHASIHPYIHTYIHSNIHTDIQTYIQTCRHMYTLYQQWYPYHNHSWRTIPFIQHLRPGLYGAAPGSRDRGTSRSSSSWQVVTETVVTSPKNLMKMMLLKIFKLGNEHRICHQLHILLLYAIWVCLKMGTINGKPIWTSMGVDKWSICRRWIFHIYRIHCSFTGRVTNETSGFDTNNWYLIIDISSIHVHPCIFLVWGPWNWAISGICNSGGLLTNWMGFFVELILRMPMVHHPS